MDQYPPFLVFLYLRKVYNNLYRGRLLKNYRGLWDGTKTTGITSIILVETGSSHLSEFISCTWVKINHRGDTGRAIIAYNFQCGSRQHGPPLDVTHSWWWIRYPWRDMDGGRMVHGSVLCIWWHDRIKGTIVDSRGYQCSLRNLQKGRTRGQCWKIQYHDLQAKGDSRGDVRGRFHLEE